MKIKQLILLFTIFICSSPLWSFVYHEIAGSARTRALGGATVAFSQFDSGLIYSNPAGLAWDPSQGWSFSGSLWLYKMIESPNYLVDAGNWNPVTENSPWTLQPLPIQGALFFNYANWVIAPAFQLIGGWGTQLPETQRTRFCNAYGIALSCKLGSSVSLGFFPQINHMVDMNDAINHGWGGTVSMGLQWKLSSRIMLGASVMPSFLMKWPDTDLVFNSSGDSTYEREPLILRNGASFKLPLETVTMVELSYIGWNAYDPNVNDLWQIHWGLESNHAKFPLRLGLFTEENPWGRDNRSLFLTLGTAFPIASFTLDVAFEGGIPLTDSCDRIFTCYVSLHTLQKGNR
ncbi:MAG: hypothetical protein PF637_13125 [Spirochaetes bacterium]|jgi:hypothetical protein|nr:hypothetical protein [Spirochaetota bacterium]